jgi:hypothetical protein
MLGTAREPCPAAARIWSARWSGTRSWCPARPASQSSGIRPEAPGCLVPGDSASCLRRVDNETILVDGQRKTLDRARLDPCFDLHRNLLSRSALDFPLRLSRQPQVCVERATSDARLGLHRCSASALCRTASANGAFGSSSAIDSMRLLHMPTFLAGALTVSIPLVAEFSISRSFHGKSYFTQLRARPVDLPTLFPALDGRRVSAGRAIRPLISGD